MQRIVKVILILLLAAALLSPLPARSQGAIRFDSPDAQYDFPEEVRTDRVVVFWYEGEASFGQDVLDTAMRTLERLESDAGVQSDQLVRIYWYANYDDFRGALGPNSAEWIGGQALQGLAIIGANIMPGDTSEVGRMIPHEVSHVVLYQATHNPYANAPNWLEEGIAVHNQEVAAAAVIIIVRRQRHREQEDQGPLLPPVQ